MSAARLAAEAVKNGAMQKPGELEQLIGMLPRPLGRVLEIGGARGGTMWLWTQLSDVRPVCIDSGVLGERLPEKYSVLLGDSHDPATLARLDGESFDLLHIDGDHSYDGVRQDFLMYAPLVRAGGLIVLHDVAAEQAPRYRAIHDVAPFWNQVKAHYRHEELFDASEAWGGIGVLFVEDRPVPLVPGDCTDRTARVPWTAYCEDCGQQLRGLDENICACCGGLRP